MGDKVLAVSDLLLQLDPSSELPMYQQLYEQLRCAIVDHCRIQPGAKLPSTRTLADSLGVSRNTAVAAFDQLLAEGYLEGRAGSGTYVARTLPENYLGARIPAAAAAYSRPPARISARGRMMRHIQPTWNPGLVAPVPTKPRPFRLHAPSLDVFPYDTWRKLANRTWELVRPEMLGYGHPAGYRPLREAIAHHVRAARAVRCDWQQVIITNGAKQAMHLMAQVMTDPRDPVFIENPGYYGIRVAFALAGAEMIAVPVDEEGMDIADAERRRPDARMAYVTPSHQCPLGVVMSLNRRLALLDWARRRDGWIIEDDYDSEFRYCGRPIASLQGLDREDRVLYIGTFSKVLMPSLRLAYMIVPPDLVDVFVAARAHYDWSSPTMEQVTLAAFMSEGHFGRHIRRTRALYAERSEMMIDAVRRHLRGLLTVAPVQGGMHILGWLEAGVDDTDAAMHLLQNGVEAAPLSRYSDPLLDRGGLILGYAPFDRKDIESGVERMAAVLERQLTPV
jgi:GntR family transcriptional regulator/MocR family aminotransferase